MFWHDVQLCASSVDHLVSNVALQRSHLNGDGLCADVYSPLISQHWGAVLQTATVVQKASLITPTHQWHGKCQVLIELHSVYMCGEKSTGLFWWHILTAFHFQKIISILVQLTCKVMFFIQHCKIVDVKFNPSFLRLVACLSPWLKSTLMI